MATAWQTIATVGTDEGPLELRRRRDDWLMVIGGRVLMNSFSRSSEEELARLAIDRLGAKAPRRVLNAGLGMGFTLRALLDRTPPTTRVVVAELNPTVVEWCRGPLAAANGEAVRDPRVRVEIDDVARVIANADAGAFDLILLDLYEGPNTSTQPTDDPNYGPGALARLHRAVAKGGVAGIWSEDADAPFAKRFAAAGFGVTKHALKSGASRHVVYLGTRR
ncbi:MAG: spermidine synthase [Deltaproteobacteria bacterium]|nr:spermidine synthase [Deltaproteobacteria bacterium]